MKNDLYLKGVLTVIAAALVVLAMQNRGIAVVEPAKAAPAPPVMQSGGTIDVNIVSVNGRTIYGTDLPVVLPAPLDVNVRNEPQVSIDIPWSGLDVNVKN